MSDSRVRVWTDSTVLAITVIALLTQALPDGNGIRVVASLISVTLLPGAAVLTRFHVDDFPTWIGLAAGISFAFEAVVASGALWLDQWRPGLIIALLAVPSTIVVALDLLAQRRTAREAAVPAERQPQADASDKAYRAHTFPEVPHGDRRDSHRPDSRRAPGARPFREEPTQRVGPFREEPTQRVGPFREEPTQRVGPFRDEPTRRVDRPRGQKPRRSGGGSREDQRPRDGDRRPNGGQPRDGQPRDGRPRRDRPEDGWR